MSQFPIILMPTEIERIQQELPPITTFTDRPPAYPSLEPQPPTFVRTLIEAVLFSVFASLIYPISKIAGIILFVIGLGILSIYQFQRVKQYRKQLHSYNLVLEAYYKSLDIYARKEAQRETSVVLAHSPTKLLAYRRPKLLEFLEGAIIHGSTTSNIPQREVVRDFAQLLSQYFPNLIHVGWQIEQSNQIFKLDIAYIDPDTNLHIAIEVDETHNRNVKGAKEYHQNLMDAGWIVMRFSESQITQSPQSCGKAIALLLDRLWGLPQLMHRFADVHDLVTVSDRDRQHIS